MARAGWSSSKLSASKLNHSCSSSGPSPISQPMEMNRSLICSISRLSGCRAPARQRVETAVTSTASAASWAVSSAARMTDSCAANASFTRARAPPTSLPAAAF